MAASVAEPFTISLGKIHVPNHFFLLDLLDQSVKHVLVPMVRESDGLHSGRVLVVGLNGSHSNADISDLGQYPWGMIGSKSNEEAKGAVLALAAVCAFLGVDSKSNSMNRCAVMHILAALFRGNVLREVDLCTKLGSAEHDGEMELPQNVLDAVEDLLSGSGETVSSTLLGLDGKKVYKSTIIREFNEARGSARVSADRLVRYGHGQADRSALLALRASEAVHSHTCKLFDDIAVKFYYSNNKIGAEFGRIVRMRKKINQKWLDYNHPVDLNNRESVANLFIVCYYYRQIGQSDRLFVLLSSSVCSG
jgi:hypothetical protein